MHGSNNLSPKRYLILIQCIIFFSRHVILCTADYLWHQSGARTEYKYYKQSKLSAYIHYVKIFSIHEGWKQSKHLLKINMFCHWPINALEYLFNHKDSCKNTLHQPFPITAQPTTALYQDPSSSQNILAKTRLSASKMKVHQKINK